MGMPCQVNSIVKLKSSEFPVPLVEAGVHTARKSGYRIYPIEVPLQLVDEQWQAQGEVIIQRLTWENQTTTIVYRIHRCYAVPFAVK
ncbi:DUF2584 family protein [Alkalinema pantanalense CENA528]|uniref:DUF2584 family protein n=1 Tax=Alkalinema pantanalense TaxID=1620705 RepID=UPI003D6E5329